MSLFKDILKDEESLFLNPEHLDYDYQPKLTPHREQEQKYIATCIKPLFQNRNGKNIFIFGSPGIGKTVSTKHIFREIEETTDDIIPLYINCWKHETTFKVADELCHQLNYPFTQNKRTDQLLKEIANIINKKSAVILLDEIDKLTEQQIIYFLVEDLFKKTIILITNKKSWGNNLDQRLKSRLMLEELEFRSYNPKETEDILKERIKFAFVKNVFEDDAFQIIVKKTFELKDIRTGLHLLKEAGNIAEQKASKKITKEHALKAIEKLAEFKIKSSENLEDKSLLELIKNNSGKTLKDLYEIYKKIENKTYKTFTRKIEDLENGGFINLQKTISDKGGNTFIVNYASMKSLNGY